MIHILINPAGAGGRTVRYWKKLEPLFRESGKSYEVHLSRSEEHFYEICRQICASAKPDGPRPAAAPASADAVPAEPCDLVVVGGDGTINQALNGITDLSAVRLGFIPCGSGNDLAKDLRLAADGKEVVRTILSGKTARVSDVGIAELLDEDGRVLQTRRFLTGCGFGFDAAVCHGVDVSPLKPVLNKLHLGKLIYIAVAVRMIFTFRPMRASLAAEGRTFPHCLLLAAMNHRYQGGGFLFAPEASAEDGMLDLCVADPKNRLEFFPIFPTAYRGKHVNFDCVTMLRAPEFRISAPDAQWVHTDGEAFAQARSVRVRILPEKLPLLV